MPNFGGGRGLVTFFPQCNVGAVTIGRGIA